MPWQWSSGWLRQRRNSARGVTAGGWFGLKRFRKQELSAPPLLKPQGEAGGGQPHQPLGTLAVTQREIRSLYHLMVQLLFSSFFYFFSFKETQCFGQCSHGTITSATALFKRDFSTATKKDVLEKAVSFIH